MSSLRILLLLPLLLLVACGGGNSSAGSASPSPSPSTAPTVAASSPAAGPVLATVTISETEFSLSPSTVNLSKPGTYDFKIVNAGSSTHALEVQGNGVDQRSGIVSAGATVDLMVTLGAGTYDMFCPIDGHKGLGMDGKVTVTG